MADVNAEIMHAVEHFAASITVPVLHEYAPDEVDQVGTGTLFDHDGRLLLVTARHLFDTIKAKDLVLPSRDTPDLHGLGNSNLHIPDRADVDLAVVEILHPASITRIRRSWKILSLADTAVASDDGTFVLTGYPSENTKNVGGLIGSALLALHTWRLPEVPATADKPVYPDLDLFFRYELTGENSECERGNIPHLRGCSGGPIWEYREPEGLRFWTVDQCVKLVGVQSSLKRSDHYFRAKSAKYIRAMFDKLVEEHSST